MMIAMAHWQGGISPLFDVSDRLCLVVIEDGRESRRENVLLKNREPFARAREMAGIGVELLICGAVSRVLETALISVGIQVIGFTCGDMEKVLTAFLQDHLADGRFLMPGCFGRPPGHRCRRRGGRNKAS